MTPLFIASLILGLLLGVRIMLFGVERPREQSPSGERSFRLSPPVLVAFLIVFGLTGYGVSRQADVAWSLVIAVSAAGLCAATTARLVTRWWKVVPEHDVDDERYVLQG